MLFIYCSLEFRKRHLQNARRAWWCFFILSPKEFGVGIDFLPSDNSQNIFWSWEALWKVSLASMTDQPFPSMPLGAMATTNLCFVFQKYRPLCTSFITKGYHGIHVVLDLVFFFFFPLIIYLGDLSIWKYMFSFFFLMVAQYSTMYESTCICFLLLL